ncbi:protein kinase family protein [Rhynchospora pubera]|uniref:non-specific serine/threonine protein kinase n=1 Tax=Rhynchospora pubera TaxID=906938 RepID=A0AAV8GR10_9POAL|nr:protein kinase family protein [Rhynchospora pubera]
MSRHVSTGHFHKSRTLDDKYILGDEIGKGAYGRVYKGLDLANGDFVAIKQVSLENIPQEDLNIIMQEIDLLKNLNHKNIVKYLGSLKTKAHLHIILEYVENGSLANIIKPNKFGPFPESLVAVYIAQVLEGLVYLHEQGVIHRDIKGANILTTKEGLVKLADFGVATKLTEADINTHSVVGTPYWMAPEVIEMSGVCAASDIWSVGCTVIELLTCVPPYYDLQPMPALFRIVQDESPPIPEGLSPEITDFLRLCFKKDAMQRPDAKTLLMHPWIQNSRRTPPSYLREAGAVRNIEEVDDDSSKGNQDTGDSPKGEKRESAASELENEDSGKNLETDSALRSNKSEPKHTEGSTSNGIVEHPKDAQAITKDPTLVFHQKLSLSSDDRDEVVHETQTSFLPDHGPNNEKLHEVQGLQKADLRNEELGGRSPGAEESDAFSFGSGRNNASFRKHAKHSTHKDKTALSDLSRFSDSPNDAVLDDLFHPLDRRGLGNEASTSGTSHENDLASELKARMAQKQKETEQVGSRNGGLLKMVMEMQDDVIDLDVSVFDENLPAESIFPLQSVEFNKVVGCLKPEEPEQVIIPACQKLIVFFTRRPETKETFMSQHGFLPLIELLDLKKPQITIPVLQIINHLIKDNITFQENACLVGLIPVVMNFATPKESREVRMQAAFFFQQLCQSSTQTLQMFIACRGIPTLVNLLEPDYAKYREMVHLAIDGIWQVFKLQQSNLRKDFCRIAAKSGIFNRLVITLHSLNEATRLASVSGSGMLQLAQNGPKPLPRPRSGQLEIQIQPSHSGQLDAQRLLRPGSADLDGSPKFNEAVATNPRRSSIDRSPRHSELMSNGGTGLSLPQGEQVRPLLSLLEKEPPSRHVSGQLDYMRHLSGLERHESILPLLHASTTERKPNGELELLMAEFAEVSRQGRENGNHLESNSIKHQHRTASKSGYMAPAVAAGVSSNEGASTSGIASQTASGVLSGSGVLNARPGSTTSSGILSQMVSSMSADVAREYLEKAADLLLEFAQADSVVKSYLCVQSLMIRLFQMFNKIEPPILLKILKCINHLSTDPNCLETLQRSDAIKHLIPNLELRDGPLVSQIHNEVLNALFNLCKINKRRQEQAAENGIIPHLMNFIMSDSPLKQYALPLLCDMAHASRNSREQLRAHGGLDVYLSLLEDEAWAGTALDSIAVCLAHDNESRKVEQALLKKDAILKLVKYFQNCPEQYFVNILEPFLKIITKSSRINTAMATNGLTTLLIARLDHQDAIARLNLLKLIKAVYEHHPRPKQLIVENDLPQKLQNLIEERRDGQRLGGQVLVKQMATALLKALHINTVL